MWIRKQEFAVDDRVCSPAAGRSLIASVMFRVCALTFILGRLVIAVWLLLFLSGSGSSYLVAMLCYAMLCYAMLCCAMICYLMLNLCPAMLFDAMQCYANDMRCEICV